MSSLPTSSDSQSLRGALPYLRALQAQRARRKIDSYYPATGALRRELYPRHMAFFAAGGRHGPLPGCPKGCDGSPHRERAVIAANRTGKTEGIGGYEVVLHATGQYPDWWTGHRFSGPVKIWVAGDTSKSVRDGVQSKLLGEPGRQGTGLIPADAIAAVRAKPGVPEAVEIIYIRHANGGKSVLTFRSYDQGRESFQSSDIDVIWLDEEPPIDIYSEAAMRTMTTQGVILSTFTPLSGLTETVEYLIPGGSFDTRSRYVLGITWDDVPHLSEQAKAEYLAITPEYLRDARSRGLPQLGSGAIYPVAESQIVVEDFPVPDHWPRCFALDVGWKRTASLWGARDPQSGIIYGYSEHYAGKEEPYYHGAAIRGRGDWIPGVIDPAARGRSQKDGTQLIQVYRELGLDLQPAINAVEAGIYAVWQRLAGGTLKIFTSCQYTRQEYRVYRRDDSGRVHKDNDHLMDCLRYLVMSGIDRMKIKPVEEPEERQYRRSVSQSSTGWMAS